MKEKFLTPAPDKVHDFAGLAKELLSEQMNEWPQLNGGYTSLNSIKTKSFSFNGYTIKVQFNPGRLTSSAAKVDQKSISERKCFLCPAHLPVEQRGIRFEKDYIILCNPFPIFPEHFTIPNEAHVPQQISGNFIKFLNTTKDLGKYYTVFYNGPKCGASAPDHFHFQAGTKGFMTIDNEYNSIKELYNEKSISLNNCVVNFIDDGLRRIVSLEGSNVDELNSVFEKVYNVYNEICNTGEEPLLNILAGYDGTYRVVIFLREKHRPASYFAEGDANILLSPASVDIGGVCITPQEKDFEKITKEDLITIFNEVSLAKEKFELLKARF